MYANFIAARTTPNQVALTRQEKGIAALLARAESLEATASLLRAQAAQLADIQTRRATHVAN